MTDIDFTDTELAIIALVLNQNADEYEYDANAVNDPRRIATKARKQIGGNDGD